MESIADVNGERFYRCPYSHGVVGISRVPVDALFPSEVDRNGHVKQFHQTWTSRMVET